MTTSPSAASPDLVWCFPEPGRDGFVLHAGDATVGWLRCDAKVDGRAEAGFEDRLWTFDYNGGRHPHITIRATGSGDAIADFVPNLAGGGVVSFASGRRYCWSRQSIWTERWCFSCKQNKSAVCVSQEAERLKDGGKVHICPDAAVLPETPILVLLAWFLRVFAFERLEERITLCG